MTTRPTDEEISALIKEARRNSDYDYADALESWLAERQAARDGIGEEMSNLFRLLDHADGGEWRWSENGNIITDKPQEGNDPEIAAVYTEHEDDSEPANSMAICAAINFLRKNRAALQSITHPITSISDALNFLEEWALSGGKLHGDDIQQFRATVERIAPIALSVRVTDAKLDKPARVGVTTFSIGIPWSTVIGCAQRAYEAKPISEETAKEMRALISTFNYPPEHRGDKSEPWKSVAPAYNGKKEG